jgi:hypothetical protein
MADKKPAADNGIGDEILWVVLGIIVLLVVVFGFTSPFNPNYLNLYAFFASIFPFFQRVTQLLTNPQFWANVGYVSSGLTVFFLTVIIYSFVRMFEIQSEVNKELDLEIKRALAMDDEKRKHENPRWKYIQNLADSRSESDWRIAIIEADTMLDEVLESKGYSGETLSEKLKGITPGSMASLQNAWDAHLVRNKIAHEGVNFSLSEIETRRVIKMFQNFFEELNVI